MSPYRFFKRKTASKWLNLSLIVALLISLIPAPAFAAANAPLNVNADCSTAGAVKVFLPFVTRAAQSLQAFVASTSGSADFAASTAPDVRQLNYQVGKTYSYDWNVTLDIKSEGRDKEGALENQGQQNTVIRGTANVTIKEKSDAGVFSGQVTIDSPSVCTTDGTTASLVTGKDYDDLVAGLKQPLLFKQTLDGKVTEVSVPQGSPLLAVNMQKGIINALQASLKTENAYTVAEQGAQGTYTVTYAISDQSDGAHITKTYDQGDFSKLISAGDDASNRLQSNTVDLVLNNDGVFKSVKSVENMQSSDESKDPGSTGDAKLDGVAASSTIKSVGSLDLLSVVEASNEVMASALSIAYRADDLGAELSTEDANPKGIDLTTVDFNAEFAALESAPDDPKAVMRIIDLVLADDSAAQTVLDRIQARIQQNINNTPVVNAYIDVLTQVGTAKAQSIIASLASNQLVQAADVAATLTITSQEHALISITLLESPTVTTVQTIKSLSNNDASALQDTAITVLGATADHLSDAKAAGEITAELTAGLANATSDEKKSLYLDALGNTGDVAALGTIQQYISGTLAVSDTFGIQASALTALRKMPGDQAEGLLVSVLNTSNEEIQNEGQDPNLFAQRELAYALLANRAQVSGLPLSAAAHAAITTHNTAAASLPGGYYTFSWNRHLGGSTVGVNLPGFMGIATPPPYYPYLFVRQAADAHIWSYTRNLLYGQLLAYSNGSAFNFQAYVHIGGGLIKRQIDYSLPCTYSAGGNLYNTNIKVFDVTLSYPIFWALTINFNISATGYFSLNWTYNHNVCSLSSGNFRGQIIPVVWVRAEASAYVSFAVVRGGVTLEADLLRTSLPATGTIAYGNGQVSFCVNVSAVTQALSGRFYIWGDYWLPFHWRRAVSATIWTFSTPTGTYSLYDRCF